MLPKLPHTLQQAIARMEGFYLQNHTPSRPQRNCNPGDIVYGEFAKAHGATGCDGRFAVFPDAATGFACLTALLKTPTYATLTIEQAVNRYAPPFENNTSKYVHLVTEWTGLKATDIVGECLKG